MKRFMAIGLMMTMLLCGYLNANMSESKKFSDVAESHWAYSYIMDMAQRGVVGGYPDGTFKPDSYVSRAEFAKMMLTVAEMDTVDTSVQIYSDVETNSWYAPYIHAVQNYLNGYADEKSFKPNAPITREEVAVALVKMKGYRVDNVTGIENMFTDCSDFSEYIKGCIMSAVNYGVISGYSDKTFRGQYFITRAEAAALLSRAYSETESTRMADVWVDVDGEWAAGYCWSTDGEYLKITDKNAKIYSMTAYDNVCATPVSEPIAVTSGESYSAHLNCYFDVNLSDGAKIDVAPIIITDDNGNVVWVLKSNSTPYCDFVIPEGGTKLYISYYNNQSYHLKKRLRVSKEESTEYIVDRKSLERSIEEHYENYIADKPAIKDNDKAYIIFTVDDCRKDLDVIADEFIARSIPLCVAAIPGRNMMSCASRGEETRIDVCRRIAESGGEILAHNGKTLTSDNFDFDAKYNQWCTIKKQLEAYGFEVNGIILAGGTGQNTIDFTEAEKWSSYFYSYSDLYGIAEPYHHPRVSLYKKDLAFFKEQVNLAIENKKMVSFFFHDTNELELETLKSILEYVKSLPTDEVEVVTYKEYYDKVLN